MQNTLSDGKRLTLGAVAVAVTLAITAYQTILLEFGFFDRGLFYILGTVSLLASISAALLFFPLERLVGRLLLILSGLLRLFWVVELGTSLFRKH